MPTILVAPEIANPAVSRSSTSDCQLDGLLQKQIWIILSGLVHDLRQPLSVIEICADYLNLILPAGEPKARQQLELMQQQIGDAERLICEALQQAKLSYGQTGPEAMQPLVAASRSATNAASPAVPY